MPRILVVLLAIPASTYAALKLLPPGFGWPIAVFWIALVLFHIRFVWVRKWRLSPIGWKKVDYYWLSLAALGVLGTFGSTNRAVAARDLEYFLPRAARTVSSIRREANALVDCRAKRRSEDQERVCHWIEGILRELPESLTVETLESFAFPRYRPGIDDTALDRRVRVFHDRLTEWWPESAPWVLQHAADAKARLQTSSLERGIAFTASFLLLPLGLALRLTKVSGELRAMTGHR